MTQYNDIAYNIRIKVTDVSDLSPTTKLMALPGFTKNSSLSPYVSVELGDVHLGRTGGFGSNFCGLYLLVQRF